MEDRTLHSGVEATPHRVARKAAKFGHGAGAKSCA